MRIGLIAGPWFPVPPPGYGGIERVVDTLARGFAAAGEEVLLAAPADSSCPVLLAAGLRESDSADLGLMREAQELEYFHDVVEPVLEPDQEVLGELGDAEKYALAGNAMAFLNPIQWPEPFGLVMIEALATGTPVVGTPAGAAPEIVDNGITGYLAPIKELAGLLHLAQDLDRGAFRAAAEERFSAERMVNDHLDLFRETLNQ